MPERPSMESLFKASLRLEMTEDINRQKSNIFQYMTENRTFYDRVIANLIISASLYYSREEINNWLLSTFRD